MDSKDILSQEEGQDKAVDFREILFNYLVHWKWFVASIIVAMGIAFFILARKNNVYTVTASVLMKNDKSGATPDMLMMESLGMVSVKNNLENEVEIMRSKNVMLQVVMDLELYTNYVMKKGMRKIDLYKDTPIELSIDSATVRSLVFPITIHAVPKSSEDYDVKVSYNGENKSLVLTANPLPVNIGDISFTMTRNFAVQLPEEDIIITVSNPRNMANYLSKAIVADALSKGSTILTLSLNTFNIAKAKDVLNRVVFYYNELSMAEKNRVALNTERFIDERIVSISKELGNVEKQAENFRKAHKLTDVKNEGEKFTTELSETEKKLFELETQLNLVDYVDQFVSNKQHVYTPIPYLGITDAGFSELINKYNQMLLVRERLLRSSSEDNPLIADINHDISDLRKGVLSGIISVRKGLNIEKKDLQAKNRQLNNMVASVPEVERELTEIMRQQSIKDKLYVFLLEKREENSLNKTLTVPVASIVDTPDVTGGPVEPNKPKTFLIAFVFGLSIPALFIFLKDMFNVKFKDRMDVERLTSVPVLGEIAKNDTGDQFVVKAKSTAPIVELFRLVRNSLQFMLNEPDKKVINVTSTVTQEGKTFFSMNLALSFALTNKKVILVGLDIRRPQLKKHFSIMTNKGITSYLSGQETDLDGLIVPSGMSEYLDLLPAGPIPPNPNELLTNSRLDQVFEILREKYDYIIVDTAPVGMVSDTFLLNRLADVNLYVTRANYSSKKYLALLNSYVADKRLTSTYLIVNAVDMQAHSYSYRKYGYGYGYGYGSKYSYSSAYGYGGNGSDENQKNKKRKKCWF
jgi:capsular exopolysaccharide family